MNSSVGGTLSVHVTMIGDSGAYDAYVADTTLVPGSSGFNLPKRTVVKLPAGAVVKYAYVDSYIVAGAPKIDCPSQPSKIAASTPGVNLDATTYVSATFLQTLPPLPCGVMYAPPHVRGYSPRTGYWGNKPLTTKVHGFINSDGRVVQMSVYKSSGVDGIDDEAMASAQHSTYAPATFLCTPVVGDYLFSFTYRP
ncbi:MAG TPA: energy transducer TonB [Candidatus Tumulicola sp.]